jgi:predicted dehydrogenase
MKVCVIGCGAVARRAHIPVFQSIPGVEVASVVDTNESLAKQVSKEFGIKEYYTDYRRALRDDITLASICTPSFTHAEIAIQAAKLGKHVLVEKPLAMNVKEAKEVLNAVNHSNVQLCVVFNYRMVPAVQQVHERVRSGNISRIVSMVATSHTQFPISWTRSTWLYHYGGALDDFGPHIIDLLLWLNPSKLETVSAVGGDFTGDFGFISHIYVAMRFHDTSLAVADISWLTDLFTVSIDVHGTAGRIFCDIKDNYHFETHGQVDSPIAELASATRKSISKLKGIFTGEFFKGGIQYHSQTITKYVTAIEKNQKPPMSGEEALIVTAVLEGAKRSLNTRSALHIDDVLREEMSDR